MPFIKERLKTRRINMGLTLQEIADKIGVEKPTVQRYESGKIKKIDTVTIELLAKAVACSPAYLMGWTNSPLKFSEAHHSTDDETLLSDFHKLNNRGKQAALGAVKGFTFVPEYAESESEEVG
jgi:transcriptional regulator with XRE-family HTH domain